MCRDCDILTLKMTRPIFEQLQKLLANNTLIDGDEEVMIALEEVMVPELTMRATRQARERN